jgi:hypothetical protein
VRFVNTGSVGKPKDGNPRAGGCCSKFGDDHAVTSTLHRVLYDIAGMAAAIRAADVLPDQFAT